MKFKLGDLVVHVSDKKPRKMVVAGIAIKKIPPDDIYQQLANAGNVPNGSYYCTWISGSKKGEGYFNECELDLQ